MASEKVDTVIIDAPARHGLGGRPFAGEHGLRNAACRSDGRYASCGGEGGIEAPAFCSRAYGRIGHEQMRFPQPYGYGYGYGYGYELRPALEYLRLRGKNAPAQLEHSPGG